MEVDTMIQLTNSSPNFTATRNACKLCTPLGALLSLPLLNSLKESHLTIPTAIAAGTFIYVATMDLLPEAFHDVRKRLTTFIAMSAGILIMLVIAQLGA